MKHAYDPWDRWTPFCRLCGQREHPDMRTAAIVRDGIIGALLVFCALVGSIAWLS